MIANAVELKVAVRNLRIMEEALRALRAQLEVANPRMFEVTSKAYLRRIAALQEDIAKYLVEHPTELSLILPPLESAIAATSTAPTPTA
jgi:hypothetical protein